MIKINKQQLLLLLSIFTITIFANIVAYLESRPNRFGRQTNVLPQGYTLDNYTITEVTDAKCEERTDCSTPEEYLMRSSCPYTSLCLQKKCTIVCPSYVEK
jgi:hypothetical protein